MSNKWTIAFGLLGVLIVFGAAGTLALDASYQQTTETRNASSTIADESPPVVETGRDVSGSLTGLMPYVAFVAVPMGIIGILTLGGIVRLNQSNGRLSR